MREPPHGQRPVGHPQSLPFKAASVRTGDDDDCALGRGVRLTMLVTKEEEQRGVKEEEQRSGREEDQLMGGRVAMGAALAAAAIAMWQGGIARMHAPPLVVPELADFMVRASSGSNGCCCG